MSCIRFELVLNEVTVAMPEPIAAVCSIDGSGGGCYARDACFALKKCA